MSRRVLFAGQVQGVGFRWTVEKLARNLPVTGFVRNLKDGRVELVCCAAEETIEKLIAEIRSHFGTGITGLQTELIEISEEFPDFQIRR